MNGKQVKYTKYRYVWEVSKVQVCMVSKHTTCMYIMVGMCVHY